MIDYRAWPAASPAGTLWRVVSDQPTHQILPDGVMDLVWSKGGFWFAGPDVTAAAVCLPAGSLTWGLRLRPGLAHALFGIPACQVQGQRIELSNLAAVPAWLLDRAHDQPAAALAELAQILSERAEVDTRQLQLAASVDRAAQQGLSVSAIAADHNLSQRSLHRLSQRWFGYSPKTLASIHRFSAAMRLVRTDRRLAEIAVVTGYSDQAHLARAVKRFTGSTLTALRN